MCQLYNNNGTRTGDFFQLLYIDQKMGQIYANTGTISGQVASATTPCCHVVQGVFVNNVQFRYTVTFVGTIVNALGGPPSDNVDSSLLLVACNNVVRTNL
jgi:hypothetical protein